MRLQCSKLVPHEVGRARFRRIQAGQHIEQRRLARAVRADQTVNIPLADAEAHFGERLQAAEALAQLLHHQQQFGHGAGAAINGKPAHAASFVARSSRRLSADGHNPSGRKIITSTRANPNISMRMPSGSKRTSPKAACCNGTATARNSSGKMDRSKAPMITPGICPMPPSTTMHNTVMDSVRLKLSGLTKPCMDANMQPAIPPNDAPMAKASSLILRVLMPIALAAISSSRTASHALPMRECCSLAQITTMMIVRNNSR